MTLIRACAKASRSDVAEAMYWDLRRQKLEVTRAAGSALIVSLCAADATARAQTVYDDMMMVAAGDKSSPVRTPMLLALVSHNHFVCIKQGCSCSMPSTENWHE